MYKIHVQSCSFLDNYGGDNGRGWGWGCHVPYDQSHAKPIIYEPCKIKISKTKLRPLKYVAR